MLKMVLMMMIGPFLHFIRFLDYIDGYTILLLTFVLCSSLRSLCSQFVRAKGMVKLFSSTAFWLHFRCSYSTSYLFPVPLGCQGIYAGKHPLDLCSAVFLFIVAKLDEYTGLRYYNKRLATSMMKFSVPLIPTVIMWVITGFSDRLFIRYMHSDRVALGQGAAGIYGYASKVPNLISMVSTIFFSAWNMSAIMENDSEDRSSFYEKVYGAYESLLFIASAFLIAGVHIVTPIFVTTKNFGEYGDVYMYTPVLVIAVLFMCLDQFLSSIYTATKHTKNSFWTSFVASMANIVLNIALIPEWGIQGACIATFLSYYLCFWARIIDARYYVPFRFDWMKSFINTAVLLVMCWVILAKPALYGLWLVLMVGFVIWSNYKALLTTVQKLLKRA